MKIQISTDYAIRILQYLHENRGGTHTAMTIAAATGITYPFFIKIANQLKKEHLLISVQGRNGGYALGKPASQISVYDVFLAVEGELQISRCTQEGEYSCNRGTLPACGLRDFLYGIQEGIIQAMAEMMIADLIHPNEDSDHQGLQDRPTQQKRQRSRNRSASFAKTLSV